ncbi:transcription activator effector binding [Methylobacterium sp. 4-46]|uniref:GyrI-like domain-containing protein n=1 Tax=unclassified Methylobacterium TaxID=2615210 RepID=UPI000165C710|nr:MULTISPECIES: GyrI-like domain-containing protein [Methylobacterium]ACA18038.1 transcription activator effector binding [Methylobacterium sp. 4-46]WFT77340.1 GyrI-like domain-containing protein [Methylobacterium nodulans]
MVAHGAGPTPDPDRSASPVIVSRLPLAALGLALALAAGSGAPRAQQPPAQANPLPTTTDPGPGPRSGEAPAPPLPEKAVPPGPAPAGPRQTLVPNPGDPSDVDEVMLPAKPAAILAGNAKWDAAVPTLRDAFARLEGDLAKAGVRAVGRPVAVFTRTDDDGFQFEAMLPIEQVPDPRPAGLPADLRFGSTPSGKALRFVHKGAYDEIDQTYETVTAYLDAKGIIVQDAFVEEYLTDLRSASDTGLEVNIYALPKEGGPR